MIQLTITTINKMLASPQNGLDLTFWFIALTFLVAIVWGLSAIRGSRRRYLLVPG